VRLLHRGLPRLVIVPVKTYENPEEQKSLILRENKNKSIIYRWVNKINNKEYIGSSSNAHVRLAKYFDKFILQNINMSIYKAILKYGSSNFILQIIEYCEPENVISREQFYLDNFDFEYNQLSKANSSLGFKHSEETLARMKGRKNALGYKHTASTKKTLSLKSSSTKHSAVSLSKMRELWAERKFKKKDIANSITTSRYALKKKAPHSKKVIVKNIEDNTIKTYNSITDAAKDLNLNRSTVRNYIHNKNVFTIYRMSPGGAEEGSNISTRTIEKYSISWAELPRTHCL
jgi:group I intron endonuclease